MGVHTIWTHQAYMCTMGKQFGVILSVIHSLFLLT